jgi:hypothetical protein
LSAHEGFFLQHRNGGLGCNLRRRRPVRGKGQRRYWCW